MAETALEETERLLRAAEPLDVAHVLRLTATACACGFGTRATFQEHRREMERARDRLRAAAPRLLRELLELAAPREGEGKR